MGVELIFFYVYQIFFINVLFVVLELIEEIEWEGMYQFEEILFLLQKGYGNELFIWCIFCFGFFVEEIVGVFKEVYVDLIIGGMFDGGFILEKVLGSVFVDVMIQVDCLVIFVCWEVYFKYFMRIVLVVDLCDMFVVVLDLFKKLFLFFKLWLYILNIIDGSEGLFFGFQVVVGFELDYVFCGFDCFFYDLYYFDVVEGIEQFIFGNGIDLVVIILCKYGFWFCLFCERVIMCVVFYFLVLLLVFYSH